MEVISTAQVETFETPAFAGVTGVFVAMPVI
jgi:hypothetical protein